MSENSMDLFGSAKELVEGTKRLWMDVDIDEQDYLDRLATFGEGYFDFSAFHDAIAESGEMIFKRS
jgi:hypothetical protein